VVRPATVLDRRFDVLSRGLEVADGDGASVAERRAEARFPAKAPAILRTLEGGGRRGHDRGLQIGECDAHLPETDEKGEALGSRRKSDFIHRRSRLFEEGDRFPHSQPRRRLPPRGD
jgi:hypothetical protein